MIKFSAHNQSNMDQRVPFISGMRSLINKLVNDDFFKTHNDLFMIGSNLLESHSNVFNNINGIVSICNFTTGQYEYIGKNIKDHLGYDIEGYSSSELTGLIASIIYDEHAKFMLEILLPAVFRFFQENTHSNTALDYRYTCCAKLKNAANKYYWYLIDTVIIKVDENGFPVATLITGTNINQFKKDDCIYYNILKKNSNGVYDVMLEGTANSGLNEYKLTAREIQVIHLISQGYSNKQIAAKLFIALHTVQTHRKNILKKTHCQGTAELTNFAFSRGLL